MTHSNTLIIQSTSEVLRFEPGLQSNLGCLKICRRTGQGHAIDGRIKSVISGLIQRKSSRKSVISGLIQRKSSLKSVIRVLIQRKPPHIVGVNQGQCQSTGEELKKQHPNASLTPTSHFFADIAVFRSPHQFGISAAASVDLDPAARRQTPGSRRAALKVPGLHITYTVAAGFNNFSRLFRRVVFQSSRRAAKFVDLWGTATQKREP